MSPFPLRLASRTWWKGCGMPGREMPWKKTVTERMGRYVLQALIGDDLWQKIRAWLDAEMKRAKEAKTSLESLEMALRWSDTAPEIHRLPWEMMRDEKGFLAERLHIALT